MTILERAIKFVSPQWALSRARAATQLQAFRSYDGAGRGRRLSTWNPIDTSSESESYGVLGLLRARSRDLVRNNGWVKRGVSGIVSNAVGTGIIATVIGSNPKTTASVRDMWRSWADSTACSLDGRRTFSGIQSLAMKTIVESGEVLIRRVWTNDPKVPIRLQVLEGDYLDVMKDGPTKNGGRIVQGVEIDKHGRRVGYWIFPDHPGNFSMASRESFRVSHEDILHVFREDRPGQVRGIPWTAAAMVTSRDLDDFESAELLRRKIAACFTAFVIDSEPGDIAGAQNSISEKIEPGAIEILPPGKDIRFGSPPAVPYYGEYISMMLKKISAGLDCPYEVLTGDYSQVNFSSGRMGWIEFQRSLDQWRWEMLVPLLCGPVWEWFSSACSLANGINFQGIRPEWTTPRREMIDPAKEISATTSAIRAGLISHQEALRQQGYDPELTLKEIADNNAQLDALGIILDSDPRKTAGNGARSVENGSQNADTTVAG